MELHALRSRQRKWLAITIFCALSITIVCLVVTRNAAVSLLQDGPAHDEFVADLTHQIARQVLPQMDEFGIQASYGTLSLPEATLPIPHHHTSPQGRADKVEPMSRIEQSSSTRVEEKTNVRICGATDDPQKPLGHLREQTVSEYQTTVTKIVNDLAAIRDTDGNGTDAGLSAGAVASLFVSRVQEGLSKPSFEDQSPLADSNSSKDAR